MNPRFVAQPAWHPAAIEFVHPTRFIARFVPVEPT
jgi:hypothetical protein